MLGVASERRRRLGYRFRRAVGPWIDRAVRLFVEETYLVYPGGYAGTVHCDVEEIESRLSDRGFAWNPVSMYHFTPSGNPSNGSWVRRPSALADRQLHAVLVRRGPDRVDVYAHEEYSWLRHPLKHARDAGLDRDRGAERMRSVLADLDVEHSEDSYLRRKLSHLDRRVRRLLDRTSLP